MLGYGLLHVRHNPAQILQLIARVYIQPGKARFLRALGLSADIGLRRFGDRTDRLGDVFAHALSGVQRDKQRDDQYADRNAQQIAAHLADHVVQRQVHKNIGKGLPRPVNDRVSGGAVPAQLLGPVQIVEHPLAVPVQVCTYAFLGQLLPFSGLKMIDLPGVRHIYQRSGLLVDHGDIDVVHTHDEALQSAGFSAQETVAVFLRARHGAFLRSHASVDLHDLLRVRLGSRSVFHGHGGVERGIVRMVDEHADHLVAVHAQAYGQRYEPQHGAADHCGPRGLSCDRFSAHDSAPPVIGRSFHVKRRTAPLSLRSWRPGPSVS